jgi:hypothetical protein
MRPRCLLLLAALVFGGCAELGRFKVERSWDGKISPIGKEVSRLLATGDRVSLAIVVDIETSISAELFRAGGADIEEWRKGTRSTVTGDFEAEYLKRYGDKKNFQLVDRSTLDKITDEWLLTAKSNVTEETRLKIGALTGATHLIFVHHFRSRTGPGRFADTRTTRLIDAQTGQVLATTSETHRR